MTNVLPDFAPTSWLPEEREAVTQCPICESKTGAVLYEGLTDRVFFCSPDQWTLYRCGECGCAYLNPRPSPASLGKAYATYYTHDAPMEELEWERKGQQLLMYKWRNGYLNARYGYQLEPNISIGKFIYPFFPLRRIPDDRDARWLRLPASGGRLLDVGCGNGEYLKRMKRRGWEVYGVDFDSTAVESAAKASIEVIQGALEDVTFPDGHFDAMTMSHLIEHLYDPVGTLRHARRLLKPGGLLWIATPNLDSWVHERFKKDWRGLEPPRHIVIFNRASLTLACRKAGLEIAQMGATTQTYFGPSAAIATGQDPTKHYTIPAEMQKDERRAENITLFSPARAEEMVVMARRPL